MKWKEVLKKNKIAIIRHGNTNSVSIYDSMSFEEKDSVDLSRFLTAKGILQCKNASETYMKSLLPLSNIYLVSPAKRCLETANLMLESKKIFPKKIEAKFLYPDQEQYQKSEELFSKLKYQRIQSLLHDISILLLLQDNCNEEEFPQTKV